jgi:outer membrane lipopolysaccharide assembly protein LptE/RlpB
VRLLAIPLLVLMTSCGYHVAGRADLLPATVKTIAVPAFGNATIRYKLTDRVPQAISRELLTRTRYKVVSDVNEADAVLRGNIINYFAYSTIYDPVKSRATAVELHLVMQVTLTERATGKVLFTRPSFEVNERYEISIDPNQYFEESDVALDRVSQQAARLVVSAILENF